MSTGEHAEAGSPGVAEPPDAEGPVFSEVDPSGRYGRFDQVLGRGAFKTVYKAFDTQEGTEVAWNQVKVGELVNCRDSKEERDRLFAEIRVLKQLKHKNIMTFYDSWLDPKTMSINFITELFTSGTLRQYRKRHKHIDEEVLKKWAWQILCGLVYLHGHTPPIIHRDLKCDNIFINGSDGTVKIGDLGLATMLRNRTAPQSVLGTPEFMAPELYEEEYDDRVDVYSFGMCMLELATMEYPYSECKNAAQIYRKVSLGVRPAGLQKVHNQELADFINLCISPREQRPRSRMLLKHPYFDSIRPPGQLASKSQVGLANLASNPDSLSDYGGSTSGLSRSSSVTAEGPAAGGGLAGAAAAAAAAREGLPPPGAPPSAGSAAGISRTVSAATDGGGHGGSDAGSLKSHRSNVSDLTSVLTDITEEGEGADNGEDAVGAQQEQQGQRWEEEQQHHATEHMSYAAVVAPFASGFAPPSPSSDAPSASSAGGSPPRSLPPGSPAGSKPPSPPLASPARPHSSSPVAIPAAATAAPRPAVQPTSVEEPEGEVEEEGDEEESELEGELVAEEGRARAATREQAAMESACVAEGSLRRFVVVGKYQEDNDTFSLRLRICEPSGQVRTVEFEFDISRDTAISVASEMVEDLQLSQEDAAAIATAIRNEITSLTTHLEEQVSLSLEQASAALQEGLYQSAALANSSPRPSYMDHAAKLAAELAAAKAAGSIPGGPPPAAAAPAAAALAAGSAGGSRTPAAASAGASPPGGSPPPEPALPLRPPGMVEGWQQGGGTATPTASLVTAKSLGSASSLHSISSAHSGETAATAVSHLSSATEGVAVGPAAGPAALARPLAQPGQIPSPRQHQQQPAGVGPLPQPPAMPAGAGAAAPSPSALPHPAVARLVRSNSASGPVFGGMTGGAVYARSATMPGPTLAGSREPGVLAPGGLPAQGLAAGSGPTSGALSPSSGVLSPAASHDKRIPLHKLFENLQDLATLRASGVGVGGYGDRSVTPPPELSAAAAGGGSLPAPGPATSLARAVGGSGGSVGGGALSPRGPPLSPRSSVDPARLPPLPGQHQQQAASRPLSGSLSGSALSDGSSMVAQDAALMRPASEACLAGLLERFDPFNLSASELPPVEPVPPSSSAPARGPGLLAAAASEPYLAGLADAASPLRPCHSGAIAMLAPDTAARLAEAAAVREAALGGLGHHQHPAFGLSAPGSKAASRDASPSRALSPSRAARDAATALAAEATAALMGNGVKPAGPKAKTDASKEALRKQAADAMKAVELRSLNLLEGGLLAGKTARGTPMAATKLCAGPAGAGVPPPPAINAVAAAAPAGPGAMAAPAAHPAAALPGAPAPMASSASAPISAAAAVAHSMAPAPPAPMPAAALAPGSAAAAPAAAAPMPGLVAAGGVDSSPRKPPAGV